MKLLVGDHSFASSAAVANQKINNFMIDSNINQNQIVTTKAKLQSKSTKNKQSCGYHSNNPHQAVHGIKMIN